MSIEQIARDMKLGTFPNKSEATLREERCERPLGSNADEWHLFLSLYLDSRATQPNGLTYVAVEITDAIEAASTCQPKEPKEPGSPFTASEKASLYAAQSKHMSDLVKRLRAMPSSFNDALRTMDDAAARIEALEAALRNAITALQWCDAPDAVKKARAALAPDQSTNQTTKGTAE